MNATVDTRAAISAGDTATRSAVDGREHSDVRVAPWPEDLSQRPGGAFITGGTGAIGRAVCVALATSGSDIAFTWSRNERQANDLVDEIRSCGRRAQSFQVDLRAAERLPSILARSADAMEGIHTVAHCAGPHIPQLYLSRVPPEQFESHLMQEASAFFNLVSAALVHLRASRGSLVAVTTVATRRYPIRDGLSSSTKASVEALVRAVAAEEGRFGVRANCVGPGMLSDGMAARLMRDGDIDLPTQELIRTRIPLRRFGTAQDVADAVCFLASTRAAFITGQALDVDGGFAI